MKVKWQGKEYVWNPYNSGRIDNRASGNHKEVYYILKDIYDKQILEEVHLPGTRLHIDFFLPANFLAIEVQGRQHIEYTPFYHRTKQDFLDQKKRDREKREWLAENSIDLLELHDWMKDEWTKILKQKLKQE